MGVQNIAEGSKASATSKKSELKLTNVARASLEELRLDYEDFLRQRGLAERARDDDRRAELVRLRPQSLDDVRIWAQRVHEESRARYEEISANAALTLIAVASALLDRQLQAQAEAFSRDGGFTERLYRHRRAIREKH